MNTNTLIAILLFLGLLTVPIIIYVVTVRQMYEYACQSINEKFTDFYDGVENTKVECNNIIYNVTLTCVSHDKWDNCNRQAYIIK